MAALLLASAPAWAASQTFGDYTVHYIAVNSTFISAEIAEQYGIVRGNRRAFLNISVLKDAESGPGIAVSAEVTARKINLLQQSQPIPFMEIRAGDAIYYLGQFDFSNGENLRFELEVQPHGEAQSHSISWSARLYSP